MGSIPSSVIQPFPGATGYSSPFGAVDLAAHVPDPAKIDAAFASGFNQANAISDNMLLRPKQVQAEGAKADLATVQARSDMGMVPLRAAGETSLIAANTAAQDFNRQAAIDQLHDAMNPGNRVAGQRYGADATSTAFAFKQATQDLVDAQKNSDTIKSGIAQAGGTPTPEMQVQSDKADSALESAISAKAKAAHDADEANTRAQIYAAQTAADRAKTFAGMTNAQIAEAQARLTAPDQVAAARAAASTAAAQAAVTNASVTDPNNIANILRGAQDTFNTARITAGSGLRSAAAAGAAVGNPVDPSLIAASTPVLRANVNAAGTGALTQDLIQQAQFNMYASQIASGGGGVMLSYDEQKAFRIKASENDVPGAMTLPFQDVVTASVETTNRKIAQPVLAGANVESKKAQESIDASLYFRSLLDTNTSTGVLYSVPGIMALDKFGAQLGIEGSEVRRQFGAFQAKAIPEATRGLGRMTAPDIGLFQQALPGANNTPATNRALIAGTLANSRVAVKEGAFMSQLVGPVRGDEAQALWAQYRDQNPIFDTRSTKTAISINPSSASPDEYLGLLKGTDHDVNKIAAQMRSRVPVEQLPSGNTPEELAAIGHTYDGTTHSESIPFYSKMQNGRLVAAPNPAYWTPVAQARSRVQQGAAGPPSTAPRVPVGGLLGANDFSGVPIQAASGAPQSTTPPPLSLIRQWYQ